MNQPTTRLYRFEPLVPLALAGYAVTVLTIQGGQRWQWLVLAMVAASSAYGSVLSKNGPRLASFRAFGLTVAALALALSTGGLESPLVLWLFVIAAVYPLITTYSVGAGVTALLVVVHLSLGLWDSPFPVGLAISQAFLLGLMGLLINVFGSGIRNYAEMHRLATTDDLTGLFNRRHFLHLGEVEMQRARRLDEPLTVVMIDCNAFKSVNDEFGHAAGDDVLRGIAECLRRRTRNIDILSRIGGDEFALLLQADENGSYRAVDRIREDLANAPLARVPQDIYMSIAAGVVELTVETSFRALLKRADSAMYDDKRRRTIALASG